MKIQVRGRGQFPIDMLRYDACWPYDQASANQIVESYNHPEKWTVIVETNRPHFTPDRWSSFMCGTEIVT